MRVIILELRAHFEFLVVKNLLELKILNRT